MSYRTTIQYDSDDDLKAPFDNGQLLLDDKEDDFLQSMEYKLLSDGEIKGPQPKYKQISPNEGSSTPMTAKSPLKMVFKKTSNSMTTVSSSVSAEPSPIGSVSSTKSLKKKSAVASESFTFSPKVNFFRVQLQGVQ